ncbi:MAG TPA: PA14 domain-containing protein [Polyangia bacterium]|jgi:hypothetical protein
MSIRCHQTVVAHRQMPKTAFAIFLVVIAVSCGGEHFSGSLDPAPPIINEGIDAGAAVDQSDDVADDTAPPLAALGAACSSAQQCGSGFCTDSVCCLSVCDGLCQTCAVPGNEGTCAAVTAGSDPDNECDEQGAATCGQNGFCDGTGHCAPYPAGTPCSTAVCAQSMFTDAAACDGQGTCQPAPTVSCGKFSCASAAACQTTCASNADCVAPNACLSGQCGGITGQYFNTVDFGTLVLTRIDPNINFDWMAGSPDPSVKSDLFSVRWTGTLTPAFSETYTFYLASSDGNRLFLDDAAVINDFVDHVATIEDTGTRDLQAGHPYKLKLEYYERYGNASVKLSWSSPSQPRQIIPTGALSPL